MAKIRGVVTVLFGKKIVADVYSPKCPFEDPCCCTDRGKCEHFISLETHAWLPVVTCRAVSEDDLQP